MDYMEWFPERLAQLRMQKGVSARDMSLSLGQSESYINKIENKRTMPSMAGFFYICEYLSIKPKDFFNEEISAPKATDDFLAALSKLRPHQIEHIIQIVRDFCELN